MATPIARRVASRNANDENPFSTATIPLYSPTSIDRATVAAAASLGGISTAPPLVHPNNSSASSSTGNEGPGLMCSQKHCHSQLMVWQQRIPLIKKVVEMYWSVPPRIRTGLIVIWLCWKVFITSILVIIFLRTTSSSNLSSLKHSHGPAGSTNQHRTRVLYTVTTLAEFNTGTRATIKGQDRLGELVIPVLVDSVQSMIADPYNYHVDVFFIAGYELSPDREAFLRSQLPKSVGFKVWSSASPLGYEKKSSPDKVKENTRALARQHRYVIKDYLFDYDVFLAFEDDMRLTGAHVQHFIEMSDEIDVLRRAAPVSLPDVPEEFDDPKKMKFHGQMTQQQLSRLIPGFVRVEALFDEAAFGAQREVLPVPMDYEFELPTIGSDGQKMSVQERHIDPSICCHVGVLPAKRTPEKPDAKDLVIWETNVKAFSLRQMPPKEHSGTSKLPTSFLDWVVLMLGPGKRLDKSEMIGGFWSGRDGAFGADAERPSGGQPDLIAQQGGWMATRDQIMRLNSGLCMGSFLPPFEQPVYNGDGQESMNVEFWSGGYQLFTGIRAGCNMQRIMSIHPDHFSKHLIYHEANNKQIQLATNRMLRADHLFAQLNAVKKMAVKAKDQEGATATS